MASGEVWPRSTKVAAHLERGLVSSGASQRWGARHEQARGQHYYKNDVRPGTAGLLTGVECSRVRDSSRMYLTSFVTIRIGVELAAVQGNYLNVL